MFQSLKRIMAALCVLCLLLSGCSGNKKEEQTKENEKIEITENSERKVVEITDGGEISFDMGKKALSAPSKTLIKISAPDFPFALAKPFVSGLDAQKVSIESQLEMPDANNFKVCADFSAKSVSYKKDAKNSRKLTEFMLIFILSYKFESDRIEALIRKAKTS